MVPQSYMYLRENQQFVSGFNKYLQTYIGEDLSYGIPDIWYNLFDIANRWLAISYAKVNATRLLTSIDKSITICIQNLSLLFRE